MGALTLLRQKINQDPADNTRVGEFDNIHSAPLVIQTDHHEVHEGEAFRVCQSTINLNGNPLTFSWTTPLSGTEKMHLVIAATSAGQGQLTFLEAPAIGAAGIAATAFDKNRDTANTSSATNLQTGAVLVGGTTLCLIDWGNRSQAGGGDRGVNEWVLAINTIYAVTLTGTANTPGAIELNWYEHADQ